MTTHMSRLFFEHSSNADMVSADIASADGASMGYMQDDVTRCLRTSLAKVLGSTLANNSEPDFLKGVLSLARCQADLYGILWHDLVKHLCTMPELCGLVGQLQKCSVQGRASLPES